LFGVHCIDYSKSEDEKYSDLRGGIARQKRKTMEAESCKEYILHAIEKRKRMLLDLLSKTSIVILNEHLPFPANKLVRSFFYYKSEMIQQMITIHSFSVPFEI
jgi:hypothetical protein